MGAVSHHFFEPLGNAYEAYQAGEYFEAGRIGVIPVVDAVGVAFGVGGFAKTAAGSLADLRAVLGQYRLEAVDVPYAFGQSGAVGIRLANPHLTGQTPLAGTRSTGVNRAARLDWSRVEVGL